MSEKETQDLLVRGIPVDVLNQVKKLAGEKTASKAINVALVQFLHLNKVVDKQSEKIKELTLKNSEYDVAVSEFVSSFKQLSDLTN